jgi:D-alanyl-D-alanine carboxypeptidase
MGSIYPGVAAYVVVDTHDKKVLMAHQAQQRRPIASLTKIATAAVALDTAPVLGISLDAPMSIPATAAIAGASAIGLQPGDQISMRDALYCAMMASDNLAAEAIAEYLGQQMLQRLGRGGSPIAAFVDQMNALASRLNMRDTRFNNPHGLEQAQGVNTSTAADMARLTMYAIGKGNFNFFVNQRSRTISFVSGGATRRFTLKNTNELLGAQRIDGVKTGTTPAAGPCLIITAPRNSTVATAADGSTVVTPHRLVVVTLGSQDRFGAAANLLQQGWRAYEGWQQGGRVVANANELLR